MPIERLRLPYKAAPLELHFLLRPPKRDLHRTVLLPRSQSQTGNGYCEAPPPLQSGTARTAFPA
ncbi:hypothetical protein SAMD00079811_34070 [Scytonema sp. HK-05]|nr:hypothetical protein SAMD00079811_34070 [Scytonema sp. HK-05]